MNWGPVGGLWIPCAGSVTPWGMRLAGEEYEPNARPLSEVRAPSRSGARCRAAFVACASRLFEFASDAAEGWDRSAQPPL